MSPDNGAESKTAPNNDTLNLYVLDFIVFIGGQRGIRTPDTLFTYTRFPGVRLQPLGHLSVHF